jgi:hypothetical protein
MTAATVTLTPKPSGLGAGAIADDDPDITARVSRDDFGRWEQQIASSGHCSHPIRLRGRSRAIDLETGEIATTYDTANEPDGVLLTACGNRREHVCPSCSQVYKRDARQLVRAGLAGGKGVPETVAEHPCVFATLTAPSFGPVHSQRRRGKTILPCHPRRDRSARRCPHGRNVSCPTRHVDDDPRLGHPLCPECFDYTAAALFNVNAAELWRRFIIYLHRYLARLAGVSMRQLGREVRIRYVKVAEYQHRGAVHFHAVIRLDANDTQDGEYRPPPARYTPDLLADAIAQASQAVTLLAGDGDDKRLLRFGPQTDTRPIHRAEVTNTGHPLSAMAVANYIAKYATKTLDAPGLPGRPLRSTFELEGLSCHRHYRQLIGACWRLGGGRHGNPKLRRWAHMLGYGGHYLTKSRRYSVTFGKLRNARVQHRRNCRHPDGETDPWGRPMDETVVLVLRDFTYAGRGYLTPGDAQLALDAEARAREYEQPWPAPSNDQANQEG